MFSFDVHIHLGEVFAGLALILMATGMEVTGNGWNAQVELAVLYKDVLKVVTPHGPSFYQDIMHLHCSWKGLVGFLWPGTQEAKQKRLESGEEDYT